MICARWLRVVPILLALSVLVPRSFARQDLIPNGQVELARLVDMAAAKLKLSISYDAAAIKGTVTLRVEGGLADDDLWELTNRALAERGFTTVRPAGAPSGSLSVIKLSDGPTVGRVTRAATDEAGMPALPADESVAPGFQNILVPARHRVPKDLAEALGKLLSKPGGAAAPVEQGVLVSDLTPRLMQLLELWPILDTPRIDAVVEEIPVLNAAASAIAASVGQLASKRESVTGTKIAGEIISSPNGNAVLIIAPADTMGYWRETIASLDRRERLETLTYTPRVFPAADVAALMEKTIRDESDPRWEVVDDPLTGSLIVTATPTQHEAIRVLLERLEATPASARRPMRTYIVRNRGVIEVMDVLQRLLDAGMLGAEQESATASSPPTIGPGAVIPPSNTARVANAAADITSPLLSPPRGQSGARAGNRQPTEAEAPVTLTADEGTNTIIAVGEPRVLAQIETLLTTLDVRQPQVLLEVMMVSLSDSDALNLGVELDKLIISGDVTTRLSSLFGLSTRSADGTLNPGNGSGFTGVVLSPGDFSVVVRALKNINKGRSLSQPRVLVANNQQAVLDSVLEQPFATTNASETVATTSFGGSSPAGTQVSIKPQIAEGDHLNLEYQVSLSSFSGPASSENLPPPRQVNNLKSVATIPDGYTVVVGGIDLQAETKSRSQIPLLGAIPVIGEAFRNRANSSSHARFYVFIRAEILRGASFEGLKYASDRMTEEMGIDDGWPELQPRIIR